MHQFAPTVALLARKLRYATRNIEDIREDDYIASRDQNDPDGPLVYSRVDRVYKRRSDHLRVLTIRDLAGQQQVLRTTDEHPFHSDRVGWTFAKELKPEDFIVGPCGISGTLVATLREEHPEGVWVYNLRVEGTHTYFVREQDSTAEPVWVHNANYAETEFDSPSAKFVHDEYVQYVRPGAAEKAFETPWSDGLGLGSRRFDDFDWSTGTAFEGNTTPWSEMTVEQLSRKLDQAGSDFAILADDGPVNRIIWFGTEPLPTTGLGAQLREALAQAGIPYWVVP